MEEEEDSHDSNGHSWDDGIPGAKKPARRQKTLAQDALDDDGGDVESQLRSLFSRMPDLAFDVTVQKYNPQTKTYPQIASYKDVSDVQDIVSTEEIGRQFGGGKYKLIVRYEGKSGKCEHWTRVFELDKAYDKFSQAIANPGNQQSSSSNPSTGDLLAMMSAQSERTMQMMLAMMQSSQNAMAAVVTAMAGAKPAAESPNTELLKEIIRNSKTDTAAQMHTMVQTMKDLKSLSEPEREEEYGDDEPGDESEELANPDLLTELGKAAVPAIANMMGLGKSSQPEQQAGAA